MAKSPWQRKIDKLTRRSWSDVGDLWLSYIPVIETPGAIPSSTLAELPPLQAATGLVRGNHPLDVPKDVPGLRQGMLVEAVFSLHKASSVLGATGAHAQKGFRTWSLSSGYHAAFFAAKSILLWLGVSLVEINDNTYLVDAWSDDGLSKKVIAAQERNVRIVGSSRVEQRHLWQLLQRMLRITADTDAIWPKDCVEALLELHYSDFGRQRNALHYRSNEWFFKDLLAYDVDDAFGHYPNGLDDGVAISEPTNEDFSIALGLILFRMSTMMLQDLSQNSATLKAEWAVAQKWLLSDCHTPYQQAYRDT